MEPTVLLWGSANKGCMWVKTTLICTCILIYCFWATLATNYRCAYSVLIIY